MQHKSLEIYNPKYEKQSANFKLGSGGRAEDRTLDPLIKSQLLYQLSYASLHPTSLLQNHKTYRKRYYTL